MDKEALSSLSVKDLENYKKTLLKRIQDLKIFNTQLGKENIDLAARLNQVRVQAHKKNLSPKNFDFDDLYSLSKEKVVKLTKSGKEKIQNGISYAGSFVKKYMKKNPNSDINEDADFNSYDLSPKKDFAPNEQNVSKGYNPPVEISQKQSQIKKDRVKIFQNYPPSMVKDEQKNEENIQTGEKEKFPEKDKIQHEEHKQQEKKKSQETKGQEQTLNKVENEGKETLKKEESVQKEKNQEKQQIERKEKSSEKEEKEGKEQIKQKEETKEKEEKKQKEQAKETKEKKEEKEKEEIKEREETKEKEQTQNKSQKQKQINSQAKERKDQEKEEEKKEK